ncbi:MAG: bifunctional nuclease family protein [Acidimicrobiia bacterium]|nr:bifunctional nuclease family protein [Acidimicrobiia bacterium]
MTDPASNVRMDLIGVRVEFPSNQPMVLLREAAGTRYLAIWIGASEAAAIAYALEGVTPQRPFTHDLLKLTTEALGASVDRVTVTELKDSVYYADLVFGHAGEEVHVSSRPSDAIALAARTGAPLYATSEVLDDAGIEIRDEDEEEEIERFREFLDDLTPDDFVEEP